MKVLLFLLGSLCLISTAFAQNCSTGDAEYFQQGSIGSNGQTGFDVLQCGVTPVADYSNDYPACPVDASKNWCLSGLGTGTYRATVKNAPFAMYEDGTEQSNENQRLFHTRSPRCPMLNVKVCS